MTFESSQPVSIGVQSFIDDDSQAQRVESFPVPATLIPTRQFKSAWLQEFAWLRYDKGKMYCTFCAKAGQDIAGKTEFITSSSHFKKETVKKHGDSTKHENARDCVIARSAPRATPIVKAVQRASDKVTEKEMRELKIKFNAAYMTLSLNK